jgi:hypothetical protein
MLRHFCFIFILSVYGLSAQELNCTVKVLAQQTGNDKNVVFQTLETQLNEFINTTVWTDQSFGPQERINCSMVINVLQYNNDAFSATLQVSASRPVFNSSYSSPVYNYNDKTFNFQYLEFQNLVYNPVQFESNLISVLAFHVYMILGMDADSFSPRGGSDYFNQAFTIANYSQQLNGQGWKLEDGLQSRFAYIDNLLSPTFEEIRMAMYNYHRKGLDVMSTDLKEGKTQIADVIGDLQKIHNVRPNSFIMQVWFDAKADEIMDVLSGGPSINIAETVNILNRVAPLHSQKWRKITY